MNKYGKFTTFRAKEGRADELVMVLLQASEAILKTTGTHLNVVCKDAYEPDCVRVFSVCDSRETYDAVRAELGDEIGARVSPLLAGPPEDIELEVANDSI